VKNLPLPLKNKDELAMYCHASWEEKLLTRSKQILFPLHPERPSNIIYSINPVSFKFKLTIYLSDIRFKGCSLERVLHSEFSSAGPFRKNTRFNYPSILLNIPMMQLYHRMQQCYMKSLTNINQRDLVVLPYWGMIGR